MVSHLFLSVASKTLQSVKYQLFCVENIVRFDQVKLSLILQCKSSLLPLRFRKAGRVWCGGDERLTEPHVTVERLLPKTISLSHIPAFLGPYGTKIFIFIH